VVGAVDEVGVVAVEANHVGVVAEQVDVDAVADLAAEADDRRDAALGDVRCCVMRMTLAEAGWRVVERTLARRGGEQVLPVREVGFVSRPTPQLCKRVQLRCDACAAEMRGVTERRRDGDGDGVRLREKSRRAGDAEEEQTVMRTVTVRGYHDSGQRGGQRVLVML
jgi:hypothetical protein